MIEKAITKAPSGGMDAKAGGPKMNLFPNTGKAKKVQAFAKPLAKKMTSAQIAKRKRSTIGNAATKALSMKYSF